MIGANHPEALIVGGGPAGATLAIHLARRGRSVELVEQSAGPHHQVCGEFLSREAGQYLDALGVDLAALGAAPIHGVRLAARRLIASCELPFSAHSLTRRALDEVLLSTAAQSGAVVLRGCRVGSLTPAGSTWSAQLAGGEVRCAPAAFLATGKHDLAGHRRPPGAQNHLVAFKMYFRLAPAQQRALRGWVELHLFPGGYAGLQLNENAEANLCLLVERHALAAHGGNWRGLFAHLPRCCDLLAERLDGARPLLPRPLALASIPYGLLMDCAQPGLWRLGDQAAVIPSFSGDGISIALHSAHRAAELYLLGAASCRLVQQLRNDLRNSVGLAAGLSRAMIAVPALAQAARLWPPLLRHLATRTRIPASARPPHARAASPVRAGQTPWSH